MFSNEGIAGSFTRESDNLHVPVGSAGLRALDAAGRTLWGRERSHRMNNFQTVRLADGRQVLAAFDGDVETRLTHATSWLDLIDPQTGISLERVLLPSAQGSFAGFYDTYTPMLTVFDLDGDQVDEVVATFVHSPYYPSYNVLYEPRAGRPRVVFLPAGHHRPVGAVDLDGDGRKELLFVGIANKLGWATSMVLRLISAPAHGCDIRLIFNCRVRRPRSMSTIMPAQVAGQHATTA